MNGQRVCVTSVTRPGGQTFLVPVSIHPFSLSLSLSLSLTSLTPSRPTPATSFFTSSLQQFRPSWVQIYQRLLVC